MKNVKEWIKESRDKVSAHNKSARSSKNSPSDRQIGIEQSENTKWAQHTSVSVNTISRVVIGLVCILSKMRNIE